MGAGIHQHAERPVLDSPLDEIVIRLMADAKGPQMVVVVRDLLGGRVRGMKGYRASLLSSARSFAALRMTGEGPQ